MKPVETNIIAKLTLAFNPSHLQVLDESHMHAVPANSETHFKVVMVADGFANKRQVPRHQAIYACLAEELRSGVHALALHTFSTDEWIASQNVPASPPCLGGSKKDN